MNWIGLLIVVGLAGTVLLLKQLGQLSKVAAKEYLKQGATLIDVRSTAEFQSNHLPGALNIPLGCIQEQIGPQAPKKDQVLLLHCLSGTRSAMGKRVLKRMRYTRVFNLGSYARAESIVREAKS